MITVAEHMKNIPLEVRPTVRAARRMIRAAAPNATEVAYQSTAPRSASAMWKLARYLVDDEPVIGIGTFATHSTIFFFHAATLADAGGLLKGTGKELRYVTLRTPADADRPALRRLVRSAGRLAAP